MTSWDGQAMVFCDDPCWPDLPLCRLCSVIYVVSYFIPMWDVETFPPNILFNADFIDAKVRSMHAVKASC